MSIRVFLALAAAVFAVSSCTSNVQPSVAQFGTAITAAQSAESAFIAAINQRQSDDDNILILSSTKVYILNGIPGGPIGLEASKALSTAVVPQDAADAINGLLKPLQAYGQAMLALSGDTAATTFDTNVDNLAKQTSAFDTSVLTPLGGKGLITPAETNAVATAVKDLGNIVIAALIAKDVKAAAKNAQTPLANIVKGLKEINTYWSNAVPKNLSDDIISNAVLRWNDTARPPSYQERLALQSIWVKASMPLTSSDADKALDALISANTKIAEVGPADAKAEIQSLAQAASDAYSAYKSFVSK
jgi:hypothetical protein